MLRSLRHLSRAPRLLFALWLAFVLVRPAGVHACPVHDRVPAAATDGHAAPNATAHHAGHEAHGDHRAPQCHCIGACCVANAAALPTVATRIPPAARVAVSAAFAAPVEHSFEEPEHLLPPATAPPTNRLA